MKVAIFTPAGAAGARLIETFHLSGSPVPVALAAAPGDLARAARLPIALRVVDPRSSDSLTAAFAGCSAAVLAPAEPLDPEILIGTATAFAEAARRAHLRRIILIGDISVHGAVPPEGTDEDTPLPRHPPGTRGAAYVAAEEAFLSTADRTHPKACVLRAGRLYGARAEGFARLVSELAAGVTEGDADEAAFNGLHVDNLVAAVRAALTARNGGRRPFLITDTGRLSTRGFRRAVARGLRAADGGAVDLGTDRRDESRWNLLPARATRLLGYRPAVPPAEGIARACAWWRFVNPRA